VRKLPMDLPVVFSIDTSQKDGPDASRNVMLAIARCGDDDVVIDEFCLHCDYVQLYNAFHAFAEKHRPSAVIIEDTSNGSALISQLQEEQKFLIVKVTPKGSKAKRLHRHLRRIRRGRVYLPRGASWFGAFVGEFVDFPDGPTDRIDAMTMYFDFMATDPVLAPPHRRERSLPVGIGSRGPIRLVSSKPEMEAPGAVLVTGSSMIRGPSTLVERPSQGGIRPEPRREPITVIISTASGTILKSI
jgi:phage terminase large subunit-like protein